MDYATELFYLQWEWHQLQFASLLSTGQFAERNYWWILSGIAHIYQLKKHESQLGRNCLCLLIRKTQVTTWAGLPMFTNWQGHKLRFLIVINRLTKIVYSKVLQILIDAFQLPNSAVTGWGLVFISKFWFLQYHFWAWLRLPPICCLQRRWKNFQHILDIANLFSPDF